MYIIVKTFKKGGYIMNIENLKDINSVTDLFEYISGLETSVEKLTNGIKTRDNIIDSQIVQIADLHTDIAILREKLSKSNNVDSAEELMERLYKYSEDYSQGKVQDFEKVCSDCLIAANMIKQLRTSKHTQKRARQRLSKKNREKNQKIERLTAELEQLKLKVN